MRKITFYLPFALFLSISLFLLSGLFSDPRKLESALLERPLPAFQLPELMTSQPLTEQDLLGQPYLLNIWGTWCPTCNAELAFMTELRQQGVRIIGLYYVEPLDSAFDAPFNLAALQADVKQKLREQGDPYQFNILDEHRTLIFDLGVSGAPETFLIDKNGVIRGHHIGDLNPQNWPALATQYQALVAEMSTNSATALASGAGDHNE